MDDLKQRVEDFRLMRLPGQPQLMHIGTMELVSDLAYEVARLNLQIALDSEKHTRLLEDAKMAIEGQMLAKMAQRDAAMRGKGTR